MIPDKKIFIEYPHMNGEQFVKLCETVNPYCGLVPTPSLRLNYDLIILKCFMSVWKIPGAYVSFLYWLKIKPILSYLIFMAIIFSSFEFFQSRYALCNKLVLWVLRWYKFEKITSPVKALVILFFYFQHRRWQNIRHLWFLPLVISSSTALVSTHDKR